MERIENAHVFSFPFGRTKRIFFLDLHFVINASYAHIIRTKTTRSDSRQTISKIRPDNIAVTLINV